jgi:hypothetical protein
MESGRNSIDAFADTVKNGKTLQQSQNALDKIFGQAVSGNIKDLKQFQTVLNAGGMTGDKFASTLQSTQAAVATYSKKRITEETAIVAAFNDARKKQAAQANSGAAAAARMEKSLKELGDMLFSALEPLVGIAMDLGFWLLDLAMKKVGPLGEWLEKFVVKVKEFLTDLFSEGGVGRLMLKIEGFVQTLVNKLMDMIWQKIRLWTWTTNPQTRDATSGEISENLEQQGTMGFASGGITNQPSIFGEAGWEAAVPLPDGRTIPVTLKMPDLPANTSMDSVSNNTDSKDLLDELQLLNKNIATLITHSKANVDIGRSSLDAIKGLDGNLFA